MAAIDWVGLGYYSDNVADPDIKRFINGEFANDTSFNTAMDQLGSNYDILRDLLDQNRTSIDGGTFGWNPDSNIVFAGDQPGATIQSSDMSAIVAASNPGDTIILMPGTYTFAAGSSSITGRTIIGMDKEKCIIIPHGAGTDVVTLSTTYIKNLTISASSADAFSAPLFSAESVTNFDNVIFNITSVFNRGLLNMSAVTPKCVFRNCSFNLQLTSSLGVPIQDNLGTIQYVNTAVNGTYLIFEDCVVSTSEYNLFVRAEGSKANLGMFNVSTNTEILTTGPLLVQEDSANVELNDVFYKMTDVVASDYNVIYFRGGSLDANNTTLRSNNPSPALHTYASGTINLSNCRIENGYIVEPATAHPTITTNGSSVNKKSIGGMSLTDGGMGSFSNFSGLHLEEAIETLADGQQLNIEPQGTGTIDLAGEATLTADNILIQGSKYTKIDFSTFQIDVAAGKSVTFEKLHFFTTNVARTSGFININENAKVVFNDVTFDMEDLQTSINTAAVAGTGSIEFRNCTFIGAGGPPAVTAVNLDGTGISHILIKDCLFNVTSRGCISVSNPQGLIEVDSVSFENCTGFKFSLIGTATEFLETNLTGTNFTTTTNTLHNATINITANKKGGQVGNNKFNIQGSVVSGITVAGKFTIDLEDQDLCLSGSQVFRDPISSGMIDVGANGDVLKKEQGNLINFTNTNFEVPVPVAGLIRWESGTSEMQYYDGAVWKTFAITAPSVTLDLSPTIHFFGTGLNNEFDTGSGASLDSTIVAVNALGGSQTIIIADGTYSTNTNVRNVGCNLIGLGKVEIVQSLTSTLIFQTGFGAENIIFRQASSPNGAHTAFISVPPASENIRFKNCKFRGTSASTDYVVRVEDMGGTSTKDVYSVSFEGCEFVNSYQGAASVVVSALGIKEQTSSTSRILCNDFTYKIAGEGHPLEVDYLSGDILLSNGTFYGDGLKLRVSSTGNPTNPVTVHSCFFDGTSAGTDANVEVDSVPIEFSNCSIRNGNSGSLEILDTQTNSKIVRLTTSTLEGQVINVTAGSSSTDSADSDYVTLFLPATLESTLGEIYSATSGYYVQSWFMQQTQLIIESVSVHVLKPPSGADLVIGLDTTTNAGEETVTVVDSAFSATKKLLPSGTILVGPDPNDNLRIRVISGPTGLNAPTDATVVLHCKKG